GAEAAAAWRRDPYLTRDEFVRTMGWASKQPRQYWANTRQLVPHRLRYHVWPATLGCRNTGQPLVRARDLPQIRVALELAYAEGRRRCGDHSRGKPAHNRGQNVATRQLKVLRCFTCRHIIARRSRLPLYHPRLRRARLAARRRTSAHP